MKPLAPALVLASLVGFGLLLIGAREGSTRLRLGPLELDLRVPSLWSAGTEAPEPGPSAGLEGPAVPVTNGEAGEGPRLPAPPPGGAVHLAPGLHEPIAGDGASDGQGPLSCWEPPSEEARFRRHLELLLGPRLGSGSSESGAALDRLIDIELGLERARRRALLASPTVS